MKPTFTLTPDALTIVQGGRVELKCMARGKPIPLINWYIGDEALVANDRTIIARVTSEEDLEECSHVILSELWPSDEHLSYHVEAINKVGKTQCDFRLTGELLASLFIYYLHIYIFCV